MSRIAFQPIASRTAEIVETVMQAEEIVALPELEFSLRLVVEELVSNIVNYSTSDRITVDITREETLLRLVLCDQGIPFNPLEKEAPDVTLSAEEREIGGLGIFLVREMMDRVAYAYVDGMNKLTIEKDL